MHPRTLSYLLVGAALLAQAPACGTPKAPSYDRAALLQEVSRDVILPGYEAVASQAAALHAATGALCETASEDTLAEARAAWRATFLAWQRTEAYRFGPARDDNLGPELAFRPTRPSSVEAQVSGSEPITQDAIDALGGALKGLYALEYLLFAEGATPDAMRETRRCVYTDALAEHVQRTSERLAAAWRPDDGGFADTLASAGKSGNATYPAELSAISTLITELLTTLETAKDDKLGAPLGLNAAHNQADPNAVESPYARLSVEAIQANMAGVRALWTGTPHDFDAYLRTRNSQLAERVLSELSAVDDALSALPKPLSDDGAGEAHDAAEAAYAALGALLRTISADVDAALAVSLMFNSNDGD